MPLPFVAYKKMRPMGKDFVYVKSIANNIVSYTENGNTTKNEPIHQFKSEFLNVVFTAELTIQSGELNYDSKREKEILNKLKTYFSLSFLVVIFGSFFSRFIYLSTEVISTTTLGIIESAGMVVGILLIIYELDESNPLVKNICSAINPKISCAAVLRSKGSKIFGVTWAEIGLVFFTSLIIFTLFASLPLEIRLSLISLSFISASLYIPYSLYFQYKVIKQWCPLCNTVQLVLALGLLWSIVYLTKTRFVFVQLNMHILVWVLISVALPITIFALLKPVLIRAKSADHLETKYKRILNNPDIFFSLLHKQPKAADNWEDLGIDIGNKNASTTIIKVCNPFCGPCAAMHPVLEDLLETNNDVKLKIIFTTPNIDGDVKAKVTKHLMAIFSINNPEFTKKALDEWYLATERNYESFARKFPIVSDFHSEGNKLEKMSEWCKLSEISHTPTIFVNGWRLPESYDASQLKYIL